MRFECMAIIAGPDRTSQQQVRMIPFKMHSNQSQSKLYCWSSESGNVH